MIEQPVNFVWLERKVMEWGCMQALIDFDGWRKWKDFSSAQTSAQAPPSSSSTANNNNKTTPSSSLLSAAKKEKESEGVNGVSKGKKSLALLKTGSSAGRGVGGKRASVGGSEGLETAVAGGGG